MRARKKNATPAWLVPAKISVSIEMPDERLAAEVAEEIAAAVAFVLSPKDLGVVRREFAAWRKKEGLD